jgi:hypothetical protein
MCRPCSRPPAPSRVRAPPGSRRRARPADAQRAHRRVLLHRVAVRHDDGGGQAVAPRGEADRLAVVAAGGADDAAHGGLLARQRLEVGQAAAHLEGAGRRVVLVLDPHGRPAARAAGPGVLRRRRHDGGHRRAGGFDFFAGEIHGRRGVRGVRGVRCVPPATPCAPPARQHGAHEVALRQQPAPAARQEGADAAGAQRSGCVDGAAGDDLHGAQLHACSSTLPRSGAGTAGRTTGRTSPPSGSAGW